MKNHLVALSFLLMTSPAFAHGGDHAHFAEISSLVQHLFSSPFHLVLLMSVIILLAAGRPVLRLLRSNK